MLHYLLVQTYQKSCQIFYLQKPHVACKIVSRFRESLLLFPWHIRRKFQCLTYVKSLHIGQKELIMKER